MGPRWGIAYLASGGRLSVFEQAALFMGPPRGGGCCGLFHGGGVEFDHGLHGGEDAGGGLAIFVGEQAGEACGDDLPGDNPSDRAARRT